MDRVAIGSRPFKAWKLNPVTFSTSTRAALLIASSRIRMRLCSLASIFAVRPVDHRSTRALFRKLLITNRCKHIAYTTSIGGLQNRRLSKSIKRRRRLDHDLAPHGLVGHPVAEGVDE